jgi:hypothetical protein
MALPMLLFFALLFPSPKGEDPVVSKGLLCHVEALCDPSLEGRMALNPGGRRAAAYIARAFGEAGLKPLFVEREGDAESTEEGGGFLMKRKVLVHLMDKDIDIEGEDRVYQMTPRGLSEEECFLVVGMIPGRDTKRDDVVLVIARYDGQGRDGTNVRFPGADRNASGVAVLIETARALADGGGKVRRTVVFAALPAGESGLFMRRPAGGAEFERLNNWVVKYLVQSGEWDTFLESKLVRLPGLAGAEAFLADSPVPIGEIHTIVDLNMVGGVFGFEKEKDTGDNGDTGDTGEADPAGEEPGGESGKTPTDGGGVALVGGETGDGLSRTLAKAAAGAKVPVHVLSFREAGERVDRRFTESCEFLRKKIPCVWITTGPKVRHGSAADSVDGIVPVQLERSARLAFRVVKILANENASHPFRGF